MRRMFSRGGASRRWAGRVAVVAWIAATVALALLVPSLQRGGVPVRDLFRDTNAVRGVSPFDGALSTLGGLLWAASLGVCLLAGLALRRRPGGSEASLFFFATGALILLAMADDVFLLHEQATRLYLGGDEEAFLVVYLLPVAVWLVRFRRELRASGISLLVVAAAAFAASSLVDMTEYLWVAEDVLKLAGILTLLVYCARTATRRLATPSFSTRPLGLAEPRELIDS
jgi:hypothetical protein